MSCSHCGAEIPENAIICPNCGSKVNEAAVTTDCTIEMVDFFKEHSSIISLGLASSPGDIETNNWYRIVATDPKLVKPQNIVRLRNPRVICDGKITGLGCSGVVQVTNPLLPSPDGHLLLKMNGPLDAYSKCMVTCSCGSTYQLCADATSGKPGECYLVVTTLNYPAARRLALRPFFETDGADIVGKADAAGASEAAKIAEIPNKPIEEAEKGKPIIRKGCFWKLLYGTGLFLLIFGFLLFVIPLLDKSEIKLAGYYLYPIICTVLGILLMYVTTRPKKAK